MSETVLVGDVGGTNVRFALASRDAGGSLVMHQPTRYAVRDFPHFDDALAAFLDTIDDTPSHASFALAGPKFDHSIKMTNVDWIVSEAQVRDRFGLKSANIYNDFVAMARGAAVVYAKAPDDGFTHVLGNGLDFNAPVAVLGPGTGLGVAAILPANPPVILATEGGHTALAPQGPYETAIRDYWADQVSYVSAETLLCGAGIFRIYQAICEIEGVVPSLLIQDEVVAAAALGEGPQAIRTVKTFCDMLGTFAGNAVVTLGASGGVVLAGGVSRHIAPFLKTSAFETRFRERGPGSWFVESVPVTLMTARFVPLYGAAALALA